MKLETFVGVCFAKKVSYHTVHILTLKVFLVFFCESEVFYCFEKFFRLFSQTSTERMSEQYLRIDYNANSLSFGQTKGSLLDIEYNLEEKMDLTAMKSIFLQLVISLAIVCLTMEIQFSIWQNIYLKETSYHDTLVNQLRQNMDVTDKYDLELDQATQSWPIQFEHVCCMVE